MSCLIGVYRYVDPFPADVVVRALSIIERWLPSFFPAGLPVARKRWAPISSPADFDASLVPAAFTVIPGVSVNIPIDGREGMELTVYDDRDPLYVPACILVTFDETLPPLACLEGLLSDFIEEFQPHEARLTDQDTPLDEAVCDRRFHIDTSKVPDMFCWLTWLNPGLLEAAGPEALARLSALCPVRPLAGGALVRLQDEPPNVDDPTWNRRRQAAEDAFGLAELHRRFPRDVG